MKPLWHLSAILFFAVCFFGCSGGGGAVPDDADVVGEEMTEEEMEYERSLVD